MFIYIISHFLFLSLGVKGFCFVVVVVVGH